MMSGLWRWRKIRDIVTLTEEGARFSTPYASRRGFLNYLQHAGDGGSCIRLRSLTGVQARYKWDHGGGGFDDSGSRATTMTRRIKAEANCPRCSKQMNLIFSNNSHLIPPSSSAGDESESLPDPGSDANRKGAYQAVNLCPNCKNAYYFRPYKMAPLQGRFVEIGRVKNSNGNGRDKKQANDEDEYANKLRASFWETLRAYGGEPPEN